jgi:hypothetical protein
MRSRLSVSAFFLVWGFWVTDSNARRTDKVERAGRRITKFSTVLQQTFEMQNDYEQRARTVKIN